jgi:hypothetical protein
MKPQEFEVAPLDSYAERITSGIALLGGVLMLPTLFLYLSGLLFEGIAPTGALVSSATAAALAAWLLLNYAAQPTRYLIEADRLVIRRRWARAIRVPLKEITGVSLATGLADMPRFGLRRSFNAGVFGYHGPFRLAPYGAVFFMATNRERLIAAARAAAPPLILSPARPRAFVDALREALVKRPGVDAGETVAGDKVTR